MTRIASAVARAFPHKEHYTVQDGINFLRASHDSTDDHTRFGTRVGNCNPSTQQAMVFDPEGQGIYLAWGEAYCSRANFYYIHEDFSIPPDLAAPQIPPTEKMTRACEVQFMLVPPPEKLAAFLHLAEQFPDDADFQFQAAYQAFLLNNTEAFLQHAEKAFQLQPKAAEYRLYAGIAAFQRGDKDLSFRRLERFGPAELFPKEELFRLTVLGQIFPDRQEYPAALQAIVDAHDGSEFYRQHIIPLFLSRDLTPGS